MRWSWVFQSLPGDTRRSGTPTCTVQLCLLPWTSWWTMLLTCFWIAARGSVQHIAARRQHNKHTKIKLEWSFEHWQALSKKGHQLTIQPADGVHCNAGHCQLLAMLAATVPAMTGAEQLKLEKHSGRPAAEVGKAAPASRPALPARQLSTPVAGMAAQPAQSRV
jgi:hypothetical protein